MKKKSNYQFGVLAEKQVAKYLELNGYSIIKRRYKTKYGEIDLIANKDDTIIFVEVKARNKIGNEDIISPNQKKRNCQAALNFISEFPDYSLKNMRFDCVFLNKCGIFKYYENAWEMIEF